MLILKGTNLTENRSCHLDERRGEGVIQMLVKRHFIAIAATIGKLPNDQNKAMLISDLINFFEAENKFFNRNKFANACYGRRGGNASESRPHASHLPP